MTPLRPRPRHVVVVSVGNVLELAGAALACYALDRLAGTPAALLLGAVLLVVGAELLYDGTVVSFPLPRRPRPLAAGRRHAATIRRRAAARLARRRRP